MFQICKCQMKTAIFSEVLWKPLENYVVYEPLEILHVSSFDLKLKLAITNCILKLSLSFEGNLKSKCSAFCLSSDKKIVSFASIAVYMMVFIPKFEKSNINGDYGLPMKAISTWLRPECRMGLSTVKETLQCLVWSDSCPRVVNLRRRDPSWGLEPTFHSRSQWHDVARVCMHCV